MSATSAAKEVKHRLFLARRRGKEAAESVADASRARRAVGRAGPFDPGRYREADGHFALDFFLNRLPAPHAVPGGPVPPRLFLAWTGENEMTPNRRAAVESIKRANPEVEVVLVTPATVDQWVVEGHPLHPAYADLSAVHRSDYLRAYLMHHHGGGWSDIKPMAHDWAPLFARLSAASDAWLLGYPERRSRDVAFIDSRLGRDLADCYRTIAANCAFIARPGTPFTGAWLTEVESRLDYLRGALARQPATDPFGQENGYPVPWSALQGLVFQPLQLVYGEHIILDERLRPLAGDHR